MDVPRLLICSVFQGLEACQQKLSRTRSVADALMAQPLSRSVPCIRKCSCVAVCSPLMSESVQVVAVKMFARASARGAWMCTSLPESAMPRARAVVWQMPAWAGEIPWQTAIARPSSRLLHASHYLPSRI